MKKHLCYLIYSLLLSCMLIGCTKKDQTDTDTVYIETKSDNEDQISKTDPDDSPLIVLDPIELADPVDPDKQIETTEPKTKSEPDFNLSDIPEFDGSTPVIIINDNKPYFDDSDYTTDCFEQYSNLDSFGRCGAAYACIGKETLPTEERGEIGSVKPSGWHTVKYNDIIEGNYLYNRCHLIAYCLAGENANEQNLITGTRYLNIDGMLPYENMVTRYMDDNPDNHVLYRVTPIYSSSQELVAKGVLMEGYSVEDNGSGICFCVYAYNNQPGISIDYATGESEYTGEFLDTARANNAASVTAVVSEIVPDDNQNDTEISEECDYVLNSHTYKFHKPDCLSVADISDNNRIDFTGTRQEVLNMGYEPCKRCYP